MSAINRIFVFLLLVIITSCRSFVPLERADYLRSDSALAAYLKNENIEVTDKNSVEFLNGGHEKFPRLFEDVRNAKSHIHLEYFNFRNDSLNEILISLLAQKAAEGVEVRALFDAFGNSSNNRPLKKRHLEDIRSKGIEIVKFDPMRFPWLDYAFARDHRKIVVIDGKVGYTGGINVADYYVDGLEGIGKWRDMHARVEGESVAKLQDIFLAMWNSETGQSIGGEKYYPDGAVIGNVDIAVVDRWPGKNPKQMRRVYANAINAAKDSVQLINPYFVPTPIIRKALKKAIADGVKVEIMISEKSDIPFTPNGAYHVGYKLAKLGADVYLYSGGFNHSKIMSIDGKFCTVGSTNLNSRSLFYDYEENLFIFDETATAELLKHYNADKRESYKLTREVWKKRSAWRKFNGWLANLLTPFI
ncbi:MAG: cardiolipin synthase [Bacteroidaceae bacterium]|nr:cardiolipin synthase [Bacteroidaceae bacterium]